MEASTETWRPVLGYEGLYEVSDQGRVRSVDRTISMIRMGRECQTRRRGRTLMITVNDRGRPHVEFWKNGKRRPGIKVHRLVLEAFVGPRSEGLECCHWDGDRTNNRLENLRWDTRASNEADMLRHGTAPAKLTENDVREIRRRHSRGESKSALAREFGIVPRTVRDAIDRKTWASVG